MEACALEHEKDSINPTEESLRTSAENGRKQLGRSKAKFDHVATVGVNSVLDIRVKRFSATG